MAEIFGDLVYFDSGRIMPLDQYKELVRQRDKQLRPDTIQAKDTTVLQDVGDWFSDKAARITGLDPRSARQYLGDPTAEMLQYVPGPGTMMDMAQAKRDIEAGNYGDAALSSVGAAADVLPFVAPGAGSLLANAYRETKLPKYAFATGEAQPMAGLSSRVSERQVGVSPAGHLPGSENMSQAEREAYAAARQWQDPVTGKDILHQAVGADSMPPLQAQGVYTNPRGEMEYNPLTVRRTNATDEQLQATEALRGLLDLQGASPWTRMRSGNQPAMFIPHEPGAGSLDDIKALTDVGEKYGAPDVYDIGEGYIMTNHSGGTSDLGADARSAVRKVVGGKPTTTTISGGYPGYESEWQRGGIDAAEEFLSKLTEADPEAVKALNASTAVSAAALERAKLGQQAGKDLGGVNPTIDEVLRTVGRMPGWQGRMEDLVSRTKAREIPLQMPTNLRDTGGLLNATHFGPANLSEIDPAFAGSNPVITGGERALPTPYPKQSYLGVDVGLPGGYVPELGVQKGGEYQFALPESRYADVNTFTEAKPGVNSITDEARAIVDRIAASRKGAMTDTERENLQTAYEMQIAKQRGYFGLLNPTHDLGSIATSFYPLKVR